MTKTVIDRADSALRAARAAQQALVAVCLEVEELLAQLEGAPRRDVLTPAQVHVPAPAPAAPVQAQPDPAPALPVQPAEVSATNTVLCAACSQHKSVAQFYPSRLRSGGHTGTCKPCYNARIKADRNAIAAAPAPSQQQEPRTSKPRSAFNPREGTCKACRVQQKRQRLQSRQAPSAATSAAPPLAATVPPPAPAPSAPTLQTKAAQPAGAQPQPSVDPHGDYTHRAFIGQLEYLMDRDGALYLARIDSRIVNGVRRPLELAQSADPKATGEDMLNAALNASKL